MPTAFPDPSTASPLSRLDAVPSTNVAYSIVVPVGSNFMTNGVALPLCLPAARSPAESTTRCHRCTDSRFRSAPSRRRLRFRAEPAGVNQRRVDHKRAGSIVSGEGETHLVARPQNVVAFDALPDSAVFPDKPPALVMSADHLRSLCADRHSLRSPVSAHPRCAARCDSCPRRDGPRNRIQSSLAAVPDTSTPSYTWR